MSKVMKMQMKNKQYFLDNGFKPRKSGVENHQGDIIHDSEFRAVVEVMPVKSRVWDYMDKEGVFYRKQWLKELQ